MTHFYQFLERDPAYFAFIGGLVGYLIGAWVERIAMRAGRGRENG